MDGGVPVDFRSRGLKNPGLEPFCESQHVDGAMDIDLGRLYRVVLVMDRRGGTGEIVNFIHLDVEGKGDVVAEELKIGILQEVDDIFLDSCIKVVHTKDIIALFYETFAEMGAEKTGTSGDQDTNPILIFQGITPIWLIWFIQQARNARNAHGATWLWNCSLLAFLHPIGSPMAFRIGPVGSQVGPNRIDLCAQFHPQFLYLALKTPLSFFQASLSFLQVSLSLLQLRLTLLQLFLDPAPLLQLS